MAKRNRQRDARAATRDESAAVRPSLRLPSPHPLLAALALALVVVGAHWWLIGNYSSDVPWLDQWDAEAQGLYRPWRTGTLGIHNWFAPHNEHRIFFTRAVALSLLWLNNQWDPRLQMVVNAGLYAVLMAGLYLVLQNGRSPGFRIFCWLLLATVGSAPYAATNTLLGFQSQFYFLAGFSLLAIYLLVNSPPGSLLWIAGALAGGAALVSMASGYAAALAVLATLFCSAFRSEKGLRQALTTKWMSLLAACMLIAAGVSLRHAPPENASLAAQSVGDFGRLLAACLSWPGKQMILAAVAWLPFAVFLANYLRRRTPDSPAARFILGLGFWVVLQAFALALYRSNSGEGLEARYTDILAFGLIANAICAVWLVHGEREFRRWMPALAVVWFAVTGIGLYLTSFDGSAFSWKRDMEIRRAATAGFVATEDQRYLDSAPPYSDPKRLATLLQDPSLRPILPVGIRRPLILSPRSASPAPESLTGLSMPDFGKLTTDVWALPGIFSRFAKLPPATAFEYRVEKQTSLPFLLLYFLGDPANVAIVDSRQTPRRIVPLPAGEDRTGHHAVVYCPGAECILKGSSGPSQLAVREPKEIGFLSIAALLAALWGHWVMAAGVALFLALLLTSAASRRSPAHVQ